MAKMHGNDFDSYKDNNEMFVMPSWINFKLQLCSCLQFITPCLLELSTMLCWNTLEQMRRMQWWLCNMMLNIDALFWRFWRMATSVCLDTHCTLHKGLMRACTSKSIGFFDFNHKKQPMSRKVNIQRRMYQALQHSQHHHPLPQVSPLLLRIVTKLKRLLALTWILVHFCLCYRMKRWLHKQI